MDLQVQAPGAVAGSGPLAAEAGQYLTFNVGGETFAIGILAIKEIIEFHGVTEVPLAPACVRGVINLRGAVVPVIDLPSRLGGAAARPTKRTCIVIVELESAGDDGRQVMGVVVDSVSEVIEIAPEDIEPPPSFGARIRNEFMAGIGKVRGRFVILLDVQRVLALDAFGAEGAGASPGPASAH